MTITRRYRFAASHRLHTAALSGYENEQLYGKCNNPFGHGHDYVLEVCIKGHPESTTGLIVPIPALDRFIDREVLQVFAHRNLNMDVPYFKRLVPTTENVAKVIADLIQDRWPKLGQRSRARLQAVRLHETDRNTFEIVLLDQKGSNGEAEARAENVTLHA